MMSQDALLHPLASDLAVTALERLAAGNDFRTVATTLLPLVARATECQSLGILVQQGSRWEPESWLGPPRIPSESLLAQAADGPRTVQAENWLIVPIQPGLKSVRLLALQTPDRAMVALEPAAHATAAVMRLVALADRSQAESLCQRLTQMFSAALSWRGAADSDELLTRIAETATQVLHADRASIFLHDSRRGVLIGRPALGVEGNRLEVPASAGVVGAVLRGGQARRWAAQDPRDEVNRTIDRKLQYVTRSLVAVPMRDAHGRCVGVFEVLNRRDDQPFSDDDEWTLSRLAEHASAAIDATRQRERLTHSQERVAGQAASTVEIIGHHPAMNALRGSVQRIAKTELSVLLLGANGTGKEVVARSIHFQSPRRCEPFVAVNCAALVESLLESELFGHEKGAFTDAVAARPGKFELADGGTLFLDEVGDLTPGGQAKLLRALEDKIVVRVGGSTPISTDVRIIAATNQPLESLVAQGRFREDLFYRLNVVTLRLPPLAERGSDVVQLAEYFLRQFCLRAGREVPRLSESAKQQLCQHDWPGNVRQLRNLMERIAYLTTGDRVEDEDLELLPKSTARTAAQDTYRGLSLAEATRIFQIRLIEETIVQQQGQMTEAARQLGLHRPNLYRKMRQLGMETL